MVIIGPIGADQEGVIFSCNDCKLRIGTQLLEAGTLFITERALIWHQNDREDGITILWPEIGVQAISNNPTKCVYLMLDFIFTWPGVHDPGAQRNGGGAMDGIEENPESDSDEGNVSGGEPEITELWLIPSNPATVDTMFDAVMRGQSLNPDAAESVSEDEGEFMGIDLEEEDEFDDAHEEVGQGDMRNLHLNDERFEDAEE